MIQGVSSGKKYLLNKVRISWEPEKPIDVWKVGVPGF